MWFLSVGEQRVPQEIPSSEAALARGTSVFSRVAQPGEAAPSRLP